MDIPVLSMGMSQTNLQQASSLAVMKMAMDSAKGQGDMVNQLLNPSTKAIEQSIMPHLGGNLDLQVLWEKEIICILDINFTSNN